MSSDSDHSPVPVQETPGRVPRGVLVEIGRELHLFLEAYARTVMERIITLAEREEVDGFYVSFVLTRPSSGWPIMRLSDREALEIVSRLLNGYATLPNDAHMLVPASEGEFGVDRTLRMLASWTRAKMVPELKREYLAVIDRHTQALIAARGAPQDSPEISDVGVTVTMEVMQEFEYWLCEGSGMPTRRSLVALIDRLFA